MVKLVCISDTHTQHRDIKLPDGDILVISGDLTYRGELHVLADFDNWCKELKTSGKFKEVVVIVGNHDLSLDPSKKEYRAEARKFLSNCVYLENSSAEVLGLKFWGSPWTPFFCNWGFNAQRGNEIAIYWDMLLESHREKPVDVVVTHGPPYRILDWVDREDWVFDHSGGRIRKWKEYVGCKDLTEALKEVKPKVHVFGHIHCAAGQEIKGGTIYVNASTCTEEYKPHNPPIVIEI